MSKFLSEKDFLMGLRHLALSFVDLAERRLDIIPRTAEIRKWYKNSQRSQADQEQEKSDE